LVAGESELEKRIFQNYSFLSHRKHGRYIAVNCGPFQKAIDSELFGHEKGFYWATGTREGYFEVADGTIF
jgi:transcriptional regulator with GAF, ATPase, and Fis domain